MYLKQSNVSMLIKGMANLSNEVSLILLLT